MRRALPTVLALLVATPACGRDSFSPGGTSASLAGPSGREDGMVTVPMAVRATLMWVVDQGAEARETCDPRPGLAVGTGEGEATHLGRFRVARLDHCSIDLAVTPPVLDGSGEFEWVAADGSTIAGTYEFLFLPPEQGGFFTMFVEDGTGRFEGATGRLDFNPKSGPVECVDPLCLNGATWSAAFSGWIAIPRS